ncbi:MAG: hypothetical protein COA32_17030, partial [Fluviicola sp.]
GANWKIFTSGKEKTVSTSNFCIDYYTGGMIMPGRNGSANSYDYGFNGMYKDDEIKGEGNSYDFGARMYDSRVMRFLSIDPKASAYPWQSPYVFAANNPISLIDENGLGPKGGREDFYKKMGKAALKSVNSIDNSNANKYKAIYILAQYRTENSFNLSPPGNNPFNIKGAGDKGTVKLKTHEFVNGKRVNKTAGFASYSSVEEGFTAYIDLLSENFNDAYNALGDDSKNVDDFTKGLRNGRLGTYATDPNYEKTIRSMTQGIIKDFENMFSDDLNAAKERLREAKDEYSQITDEIGSIERSIIGGIDLRGFDKVFKAMLLRDEIKDLAKEIEGIKNEQEMLQEFKENEGL